MSSGRIENYCAQSLLANGFVFNHAETAMLHAPGHWGSVCMVSSELHNYQKTFKRIAAGCSRFVGTINGKEVEIYARSNLRLIDRIEEVVGLRFDSIVQSDEQ